MRLLQRTELSSLRSAIDGEARCDYVYMYPPRQAYRPFADPGQTDELVQSSLRAVDRLNLYIHVPFCRQICAYCNLYAVASRSSDVYGRYVHAVSKELHDRGDQVDRVNVRTVYVGGGTPSLLEPSLLAQILREAEAAFEFEVNTVPEVAIEVAPDTATPDRLGALRGVGFTRINLGVQTSNPAELRNIARRYPLATGSKALTAAMETGFDNVCVDLIFGIPGQTFASWRDSVRSVLDHRPDTICAYSLTLRPGTGFARTSVVNPDVHAQYEKWDFVNEVLLGEGYERQTHVRWALPGRGGYLQKQYHWASEPVLGVGAGARSYLPGLDVRNGYSLRKRTNALDTYLASVARRKPAITDGFLMTDDEARRKSVILGLQCLDTTEFQRRHNISPQDAFPTEFEALLALGLVEDRGGILGLTELGVRHRDVAVQPFFSEQVRYLATGFDYEE